MKKNDVCRYILILIVLLNSCASQDEASQSPAAPLPTNTDFPTAIAELTQTPEPKPTLVPTPLNQVPPDQSGCAEIVEARTSSAGVFEVVFTDSEFWSPGGAVQPALALWSEGTRSVVPFPLPSDAEDPKLSPDHRQILFQRWSGDEQVELWMTDADGQNERRLATVTFDEAVKALYSDPDAGFLLDYEWLPNGESLVYFAEAFGEFGPATIIKANVVNVNSGTSIPLSIPPQVSSFRFAPDSSQLAAIAEDEILGFSAQDGHRLFSVQSSFNNPIYSPDGNYLLAFVNDGIIRIDTTDGQQQLIPFPYAIMQGFPSFEGPVLSPLPDLVWLDHTTLLLPSMNSDKEYITRPLETNPNDWTFTIWEIDLAAGTAYPRQTFYGDPKYVFISPDGTRLAYFKIELSNSPESLNLTRLPGKLHIADLNTGEIIETITDGMFRAWSPDSRHYVYSGKSERNPTTEQPSTEVFLGESGDAQVFIGNIEGRPLHFYWPDHERFAIVVGSCAIVGHETIVLISAAQPEKITAIP